VAAAGVVPRRKCGQVTPKSGRAMTTITDAMQAELIRLFIRFDTDKNGLIDENEFRQILKRLKYESGNDVLGREFAAIDVNGDDKVTFTEFSDWWTSVR
jgi:Ca2+-binding EF-hand superfamily protein